MSQSFPEIASAELPSNRQKMFVRYFTAMLVDLVVLNLFAEYWQHVTVDSFTTSLLAAILLQLLLKLTLAFEQRTAAYFSSKSWALAPFLRWFTAWLILVVSKFVILGAVYLSFGDRVQFGGPLEGVVAFLIVLAAMLVAEEGIVRLHRSLA